MNGGLAFGSMMPPGAQPKTATGQPEFGASADAKRAAEAPSTDNQISVTRESITQLETAQAVKPTPIAASAVKIEMSTEGKEAEFDRLPITGPDKFAQGVAFLNQKEHEAKENAKDGRPPLEAKQPPEKPIILEEAARAIEKAQAEGPNKSERPVAADDKPLMIKEAERSTERQQAEGPKTAERAVGDDGRGKVYEDAKRIAKEQQAEKPDKAPAKAEA